MLICITNGENAIFSNFLSFFNSSSFLLFVSLKVLKKTICSGFKSIEDADFVDQILTQLQKQVHKTLKII